MVMLRNASNFPFCLHKMHRGMSHPAALRALESGPWWPATVEVATEPPLSALEVAQGCGTKKSRRPTPTCMATGQRTRGASESLVPTWLGSLQAWYQEGSSLRGSQENPQPPWPHCVLLLHLLCQGLSLQKPHLLTHSRTTL